jgi:hypothetical protein
VKIIKFIHIEQLKIENKEIDQVENILGKHILEPIEGWRNLYHQESACTSYFDFTEKSRILA